MIENIKSSCLFLEMRISSSNRFRLGSLKLTYLNKIQGVWNEKPKWRDLFHTLQGDHLCLNFLKRRNLESLYFKSAPQQSHLCKVTQKIILGFSQKKSLLLQLFASTTCCVRYIIVDKLYCERIEVYMSKNGNDLKWLG